MLRNNYTKGYWLPTYEYKSSLAATYRSSAQAKPNPSSLCNLCESSVFTSGLLAKLVDAWAEDTTFKFEYTRRGVDLRDSFVVEGCKWCGKICDAVHQNISERRFRDHWYRRDDDDDDDEGHDDESLIGGEDEDEDREDERVRVIEDEEGAEMDSGEGSNGDDYDFDEADFPETIDCLDTTTELRIELTFRRSSGSKFRSLEVHVEAQSVNEMGVLGLLRGEEHIVQLLYHTYCGSGKH
jgi:hypothetical protein